MSQSQKSLLCVVCVCVCKQFAIRYQKHVRGKLTHRLQVKYVHQVTLWVMTHHIYQNIEIMSKHALCHLIGEQVWMSLS